MNFLLRQMLTSRCARFSTRIAVWIHLEYKLHGLSNIYIIACIGKIQHDYTQSIGMELKLGIQCMGSKQKCIFYVCSVNTDVQPKGVDQEQSQFVHRLCNKSTWSNNAHQKPQQLFLQPNLGLGGSEITTDLILMCKIEFITFIVV